MVSTTEDVALTGVAEGAEAPAKKKRGGPPRAPKGYLSYVRTYVLPVRELHRTGKKNTALHAIREAHRTYVRELLDVARGDARVVATLEWATAILEGAPYTDPPKLPPALYFANDLPTPPHPLMHSSLRTGARLLVAYTIVGFLASVAMYVKKGEPIPSWPTESRPPMDEWLGALEEMTHLGNDLPEEKKLVAQLLASGYRAKRERLELGDVLWFPGANAITAHSHAALLTAPNRERKMGVAYNHFVLLYLHNPKSPYAAPYEQEHQPNNQRRARRFQPLFDIRRLAPEYLPEELLESQDLDKTHTQWAPSGKTAMLLPLETSRKAAWMDGYAGAVRRGEARLATLQMWHKYGRWWVAIQVQWTRPKPKPTEEWLGVAWDGDTPIVVAADGSIYRVATEGLTPQARLSQAELRRLQQRGRDISFRRALSTRSQELVPIWARAIVRIAAAQGRGIAITGVSQGKVGIPQAELEQMIRSRAQEAVVPVRFASFKGALGTCPECHADLPAPPPRPKVKRGQPRPPYDPTRTCPQCSYQARPAVLIARTMALRTAAAVAAGVKEPESDEPAGDLSL